MQCIEQYIHYNVQRRGLKHFQGKKEMRSYHFLELNGIALSGQMLQLWFEWQ